MGKKMLLGILVFVIMLIPLNAVAKMGSGKVKAKSSDIDIEMFGALKTYPHFMDNIDFNDHHTKYDRILDESGFMKNHSIRNEIRLGWQAKADNWDFLIILESDFTLSKANTDRGANNTDPLDSGMTGEDFGVEKLNFGYNFGPFKVNTGWNTKFLDLQSGGILYGDDHPYIGFTGNFNDWNWEALYLIIQDEIDNKGGVFDGDDLDWRVYTLRLAHEWSGMTLAPIYAFSDNEDHDAKVHYIGLEGYGKIGIMTPRFEFIYADGDQDVSGGGDNDIQAWGAYASVDFEVDKSFIPYIGGYYLSGDDDPGDDDMEAFNGITNISRYTPTFGMENAFVYRYVPALGSHLYSNNFNTLGSSPGYGGISNSSKGDAPGMYMLGAGAKGSLGEKLSYKTQIMYFAFAEEDGLEDLGYGNGDVDDEVGYEFDLRLTYKFNNHFSLGNVLSVFVPGDGIEDILGDEFDETAIMDTVEMVWGF